MQVDSKAGEEKMEELTKTIKRNEMEYIELSEGHKKELEKALITIMELKGKVEKMEGEMNSKAFELRMANEEVKKADNLLRAERDKHFGIKIELQKLQMESEMN